MNARTVLLMIALPLALAACGNKGSLVQAPVPVENPVTPAGAVPVEIAPQTTLPETPPTDALPDPTAADPLIEPKPDPDDDGNG